MLLGPARRTSEGRAPPTTTYHPIYLYHTRPHGSIPISIRRRRPELASAFWAAHSQKKTAYIRQPRVRVSRRMQQSLPPEGSKALHCRYIAVTLPLHYRHGSEGAKEDSGALERRGEADEVVERQHERQRVERSEHLGTWGCRRGDMGQQAWGHRAAGVGADGCRREGTRLQAWRRAAARVGHAVAGVRLEGGWRETGGLQAAARCWRSSRPQSKPPCCRGR